MKRVAIIFDNFGPYHIARLRAASAVCDLLAVEVAGQSAVYAWEKIAASTSFRRATLIEHGTSDQVSRSELIQRLAGTLDSFRPAVVVVPGWASRAAWGAMQWCLRERVPMVCMSESTPWDEPRSAWKEAIKRKLVGLFGSALVGGHRHLDYLTALGMPVDRIFYGYDVVDNDFFSAQVDLITPQAKLFQAKFNLPPKYFLASARFIEKKNLPRLLEAYALYLASPQTAEPWSLVLLGDGVLRPALEKKVAELNLRQHVLLPGFRQIEDLPAYYALAGAFVHASTVEPWGLVVNEAMACRLPVLVSNRCGCVHELVQEGVNGFRFEPTDPPDLARRMEQFAAAGFPLADFSRKSYEIISEWGPQRFGQGLAQAIESAVARPAVSPTFMQGALLSLLLRR